MVLFVHWASFVYCKGWTTGEVTDVVFLAGVKYHTGSILGLTLATSYLSRWHGLSDTVQCEQSKPSIDSVPKYKTSLLTCSLVLSCFQCGVCTVVSNWNATYHFPVVSVHREDAIPNFRTLLQEASYRTPINARVLCLCNVNWLLLVTQAGTVIRWLFEKVEGSIFCIILKIYGKQSQSS